METGTKIAIGVGAAAVVGFGIYWFFIREGEDAAAAITGTKPINEMTPDELKAMGGGKLNITQSVLDLLTPEQKAALKSAGTVIKTITEPVASPSAISVGEGTDIQYIAPENAGLGDGANFNKIDLRVKKGVFNVGDEVKIDHPNYKGTYMVEIFHDGQDGGGSVVLDTPYIDKGGRNPHVPTARMDQSVGGKISVVAEAAEGELEAAGGKNRRVRFLGNAEAKLRKKKQLIGLSQGKKGKELRRFIRTGNEHVKPKNPKTFVKSTGSQAGKGKGSDGSASWMNTHGNIC